MTSNYVPTLDDVINLFIAIDTEVVLLPINEGEKGPRWKGWALMDFERTQRPVYISRLQGAGNTGLLLGEASCGLSTIDCDTEAFLEAMLAANPVLRTTLRTRGARGGQIWLFPFGHHPHQVHPLKVNENSSLALGAKDAPDKDGMVTIGEWRTSGGQSVIAGVHPSGCNYTWTHLVPPITIDWADIVWPAEIVQPWKTSSKTGSRGVQQGRGTVSTPSPSSNDLLERAKALLSIPWLWDHFGYPPRTANPVDSPFRNDNTPGHPSFSIYENDSRFKDHNSAYPEHRGDSFDFYALAVGQDLKTAFKGFIELAGLGHEWREKEPPRPPDFYDPSPQPGPPPTSAPPPVTADEPEPDSVVSGWPPLHKRPRFGLYHDEQRFGSKLYSPGVYWHSTQEIKQSQIPVDEHICAPLEILATSSSPEDSDYGSQLRFKSKKGILKTLSIPTAALMGDGLEVLQRLSEEGLWISHASRKKLLTYIATARPTKFVNCATATGWFNPTTFVLPNATFGPEEVWYQSVGRVAAYAHAGTLEGWKSGIADLAVGNKFLIFAISFSFAGPLLEILNMSGLGVHIYGDSSEGKTTALHAAVSTWGGKRFRHEWRTTANGMEGMASQHTDTFLAMDEIGDVTSRDLSDIAYFLINGAGKIRANKFGEAKAPTMFRVALLSTGEPSIRAKLAEAGISIKMGQSLRILDLPVSGTYGIFDHLHGAKNAGAFSESIRAAAAKHHGHAGPEFLAYLIKQDRSALTNRHEKILGSLGNDLDAQTRRAARLFALVALAGELAREAGLLAWEKGAAEIAATELFNLWFKARNQSGFRDELTEILQMIIDFINAHSGSRFSDITLPADPAEYYDPSSGKTRTIPEAKIINRAGYWETVNDCRRYLFTAGGLREATKGKDFPRVLKALDDAGAFYEQALDNRAKNRRNPEGRQVRLYHIDPAKLDEKIEASK
jgi:putative DNA primase/helicase